MPDDQGQRMTERRGTLFGGVFSRGLRLGDEAWLQAMLDAEAGLARALERAGIAAAGSGAAVTRAAAARNFDAAELGELAALTGNPVPGLSRLLTRAVAENDEKAARAVHRGATSQDIIDTAAMLLARQAMDAAIADLETAADRAAALADAHSGTVMIGRTLLQQAVPVTFGVTAAGWLSGLDSALAGLAAARDQRLAVQFGGAAGTLASLGDRGPRVAALLAEELGLASPPLPWHTERLRLIDAAAAMARVTAATGKIARDVTLLAQTEVGEISEGPADNSNKPGGGPGLAAGGPKPAGNEGAPRRGGSSAMPHKNNPVASVAVLGCARQVPGLLATLVASAEQEHQRAAGAWHAEWQPFTEILNLGGSAAAWTAELLGGLRVDKARMSANLTAAGGLPLAERVTSLLAGVLGGPRAHDVVATAAAKSVSSGIPLRDVLTAAPEITEAGIGAGQIEQALDPAGYLGAAREFVAAALRAHESRDNSKN
ncbi:MAG: lyase family protein [Streptosporangiales bacterium]|nr:lyase family protein [Streptosporangiales bacterium]